MTINDEREVFLVAEYIDIIYSILEKKPRISLLKLTFYSFLVKSMQDMARPYFPANTKNDKVLRTICMLTGSFEYFLKDQEFIFAAIKLIVDSGSAEMTSESLSAKKRFVGHHSIDPLVAMAILESDRFTDRQFAKELVRNV